MKLKNLCYGFFRHFSKKRIIEEEIRTANTKNKNVCEQKSLVKSLKILKIFIFRCSRVGTCSQKYVEKKIEINITTNNLIFQFTPMHYFISQNLVTDTKQY